MVIDTSQIKAEKQYSLINLKNLKFGNNDYNTQKLKLLNILFQQIQLKALYLVPHSHRSR